MLFATFAEAMAEARGKAQAESLRKTSKDLPTTRSARPARRRSHRDGLRIVELRTGDVVRASSRATIAGDGEVIEGVASVDESAITGESAPVIREAAATGSARHRRHTHALRSDHHARSRQPGRDVPRPHDRLVEGAKRQKTPNEIALDILLAASPSCFCWSVTLLPSRSSA